MKINIIHLAFIFLSLFSVVTPISVHAESAMNSENETSQVVNQHKAPDASYETPTAIKKSPKKILINESREMSPFFKLGIAINIVMILFFSWWASKEWRRKK